MTTDRTKPYNFGDRLSNTKSIVEKEELKKKYQNITPHRNLHNFHTIKWLRSRFNHNVFNRAINTMLPNNGIPVEDPDKEVTRLDKAKDFLSSYMQPPDKFKNIHIYYQCFLKFFGQVVNKKRLKNIQAVLGVIFFIYIIFKMYNKNYFNIMCASNMIFIMIL